MLSQESFFFSILLKYSSNWTNALIFWKQKSDFESQDLEIILIFQVRTFENKEFCFKNLCGFPKAHMNPLCNTAWRLKTMNIFSCVASILKMLDGPSSLTYQASIHLLKIWPVIWKSNCFFMTIQNFLLLIIISFKRLLLNTEWLQIDFQYHCSVVFFL